MLNLKHFLKILNYHKSSIIVFVALFAGFNIFFAETGGDMMDAFSPASVDIGIINRDNHPISDGLVDYMDTLHNIVPIEDDIDAMKDALFFWDAWYILIIDQGFGESFEQNPGEANLQNMKTPGSTVGFFLDNQIENYLVTLHAYLTAGFEMDRAITLAGRHEEINVRVLHRDINYGSSFYFQFLPFAFMSVMVLSISTVLMVYKKEDLAKRMEISATPALKRKTQLMMGCAVCSIAIWLVFMVGAHLFSPQPLTSTVGSLRVLNSLVFAAVCVSIAFLIGQLVKKTIVLIAIVQILGLGLSFISGVFMPQAFMAEGVLAIARFTPTYWYVRVNDVLSAVSPTIAVDTGAYLQGLGIQLGFAIALFAVALALGREKRAA